MGFSYIFDFFFKIFSFIIAFIYLLFSIVLLKQVRIMINTLKDNFNILIIIIGYLKLIIALILLIFSIFFA